MCTTIGASWSRRLRSSAWRILSRWAEHAQLLGDQGLERGCGSGGIPGLPPPEGEVAAGGQGEGVVGAEHPQLVGEQGLESGCGAAGIPASPRIWARLLRVRNVSGW